MALLWQYVSLIKKSLLFLAEVPAICRGETILSLSCISGKKTQFTASLLNQQPVTPGMLIAEGTISMTLTYRSFTTEVISHI